MNHGYHWPVTQPGGPCPPASRVEPPAPSAMKIGTVQNWEYRDAATNKKGNKTGDKKGNKAGDKTGDKADMVTNKKGNKTGDNTGDKAETATNKKGNKTGDKKVDNATQWPTRRK